MYRARGRGFSSLDGKCGGVGGVIYRETPVHSGMSRGKCGVLVEEGEGREGG